MKIPFLRSPYNYDTEEASNSAGIANTEPSLTIQAHADDVNLNVLMERYGITGHFPENPRVPEYGDFSHISDFRSALHAVRDAEDKFLEFPAETRAFFNNDPQLMLDFASNPANMEALRLNQVRLYGAGQTSGGGSPPQGGAKAPQGGAGAPPSDGGAGVSK